MKLVLNEEIDYINKYNTRIMNYQCDCSAK